MARVQGHEENFIWNSVYIRKISHVCQKKRRCKMNLPSLRPSSHIWKSKASMYITEKPSSKAHTDNTRINTTRKSGKKEEQTKINESRLTDAFEKTHATKCEAFFSSFQKWAEKHDKPPYNETEIPQILQIYRLRGQVLKKEAFFNSCALFFSEGGTRRVFNARSNSRSLTSFELMSNYTL